MASLGHDTAQDTDKVLSGAESRHERARRTTRHGWHGTVEMQAQHGTDTKGTALRPSTAGTARADDVTWQGTAWHSTARPGVANTRAEGREPCGLHNHPIPKATGPANMARHGHGTGTGVGKFPRKARHGWHSTAGTSLLARQDA